MSSESTESSDTSETDTGSDETETGTSETDTGSDEPSFPSCGLPLVCEDMPTIEFFGDQHPVCAWTVLRDAEILKAEFVAFYSAHHEGGRAVFYLHQKTRSVDINFVFADDLTTGAYLSRCELRPASFFQACLDDPEAETDCLLPYRWWQNCADLSDACAE